MLKSNDRRPQELVVDILSLLQKDLSKMLKNMSNQMDWRPQTLDRMAAELVVGVSVGLKDLVQYSQNYAIKKHLEEEKETSA